MYIAKIPNRNSRPAYLLRESYREGGKVKNRTLANLSKLSLEQIEIIRQALKGRQMVPVDEAFQIRRSLPHGHVAAVLGLVRKLGLERMIASRNSPQASAGRGHDRGPDRSPRLEAGHGPRTGPGHPHQHAGPLLSAGAVWPQSPAASGPSAA